MDQIQFAEFLENNIKNVAPVSDNNSGPSGTELLEMVLAFQETRKVEFKSVKRLSDGTTQFQYNDDKTGGGNTKIPEKISLAISPFHNGAPYQVDARTITEKGYCHSPATGTLRMDNPLIVHDLAHPHQPQSAPGVIVEALARRRALNLPAFSVMSCDNMPDNGHVTRNVVTALAVAIDPALGEWIASQVTFPSTMVDRIVPAVTPETLTQVAQYTGIYDPTAVACEPFRQWVIEDNFVAGRPEWEKAGAELVKDVLPYEEMKLRMLNGSHSFLAYLGYLAGYTHISDCMQDENYRRNALALMLEEQAPTLKVEGVNLENYASSLIERYSNPALCHRTWQIAMDGSQKLPQRWLDSVRWHLAQGSKFDLLALGISGWMRYVGGIDENGDSIEVSDPLLPAIRQAIAGSQQGESRVQALLGLKDIFGEDLAVNPDFVQKVTQTYLELCKNGAKATVAQY